MVRSRIKYKVEYQKAIRELNELKRVMFVLQSSEEAKRKNTLDIILEYLKLRQKDEVNYEDIRKIKLSDFQIRLCRKIKFLDNNQHYNGKHKMKDPDLL